MTNLSIGDDTFRVEVEGDTTKPALLLSHGLGVDLGLWEAQMPALLKAFRVIRYDSRGHGGSTTAGGPYSIARLGRDVLGILDALEIDTVHFLGLSMGGAVGQWLLVHAPHRIERAVLANTAARFGTPAVWNARIAGVLEDGMAGVVDDTLDRWFSPAFEEREPEKVAAIRATIETSSPEGYTACCAALRDLDFREALRGVMAPVLVVSGRDDASIGDAATRHLVEAIPGAKHVALDARHLSNVEADAAFSKAVVAFLTAKLPVRAKSAAAAAPVTGSRPAKIASRRVGTRRSTAARVPLGALGKPQASQGSVAKTKRGAAAEPASAKVGKGKITTGKITKEKVIKGKPLETKTATRKTARVEAPQPKATASKAAKPKLGQAKPGKAAPAKLTKSPSKAVAKASVATKTTKPAAPVKSVKRPSAKSLKAMAASPSKARAKPPAAKKAAAPVAAPKAGRGVKTTATPVTRGKAAPAAKTSVKTSTKPGRAVAAKTLPSRKTPGKTPAKTGVSMSASVKSAPAKAAPRTATKAAPQTPKKPAPRAKAKPAPRPKPGRRAS